MSTTPPSAGRRRLRTVLRRERESANMTQDQVAIAMDWSLSKVIRIEAGNVNISPSDLRLLLDLYDVSAPDVRKDLIELARAARRPPWWAEYRETMSQALVYYVGLEPEAEELRIFNNSLMPGLVQTKAYARAAIVGSVPRPLTDDDVTARVAVRMRRQTEIFDQPSPPRLIIALDETVVRRQVGGAQVLSRQLLHLTQLAQRPHVTVRLVTFASGAHTGTYGPYILMDFADPEVNKPLLFSEGAFDDSLVRERPEVIANYRKSFERLSEVALDPDASVAFIRKAIDDLWR
jgi:transcriptional regulator with XRE-family HTH domain